jgi:predicted nucleotidyltransferase
MYLIQKNIDKIRSLCERHGVLNLFVFGSVLSKNFTKKSDIDFIVNFSEVDLYDYATNYFDFKEALEKLLKRKVDLLEDKAINNPYLRQSIDNSKQLIYG